MLGRLTAGEVLLYWGRWTRAGAGPAGFRSAMGLGHSRTMPLSADELALVDAIVARIAPPRSPERALLLSYYGASGRPSVRRAAERLQRDFGLQWSHATVARRLADCRQALDEALRLAD